MPEIGEIARIVNQLRAHLVGKKIANVTALEDEIVYKDTTHEAFEKALVGKKVLAVKQWGKYFWYVMDSPPHPLLHFGMTGWIYIKNELAPKYRAEGAQPLWPPKYLKFTLQLDGTTNEIAFADPRRLARIRLIDHVDGHDLRAVSPLNLNGPDPVLEPIDLAWLTEKLRKRKVPVKAWLLDQSAIAGVGNWVGDEILYHARLHPECYSDKLTDAQIKELHRSLLYVTKFVVDAEADSSEFPENWLMLHRWGKGKRGNQLPTGEKIEFIKVGSRTSAFVPSLQKKGPAKGMEVEDQVESGAEEAKPKKVVKRKRAKKEGTEEEDIKREEEEEENVEPTGQKETTDEFQEDEKLKRGKQKAGTNKKAPRERPKKLRNA